MTTRRSPAPWSVEQTPGGSKIIDTYSKFNESNYWATSSVDSRSKSNSRQA
jgi:hypothetical protein